MNPFQGLHLQKEKDNTVKGLIIVDVQKDFCPGGALAAAKGDDIIPVINRLMDKFEVIIATKDWHPVTTVHFDKWPVHCVRGTDGAAFHDGLNLDKIKEVALKGTGNTDDGYSGFEATNLDLDSWLKRNKITEAYVCGIASEYCVMATAMDAHRNGFKIYVVEDAIAAVEAKEGDTEKALENMKATGIRLVNSNEV